VTSTAAVGIAGLGLWLPGFPSLAAWIEGRHDAQAQAPPGRSLDRVSRRRASFLGRAVADVCAEALCDAQVDPATVQTVIGSAIAESATLLGLLEQMWRRKEPVSPAAFTMSVHNAASGLISISSGNRSFTTSLAADENTPAVALLEGIAMVLVTGQPAVVACGDESAPEGLIAEEQSWGPLAAALVLTPQQPGRRPRAVLRVRRPGRATLPPADVDSAVGRNPQIGLVDLIAAVAHGASGCVGLDRGSGLGWIAEIEPCRDR
jgi:hypothetical protein